MILIVLWFLLAFSLLWIGSGLAVKTISHISHTLRTSSFFISFFILGILTSITEITIGINAYIENTPEIFVGNLLGSSVVVYLLIIPILALLNNPIKLNHTLNFKSIATAILVGGFPALLTLDNNFSVIDGFICILLYIYFVLMLDKSSGLLNKLFHKKLTYKEIFTTAIKLIFAIILVFAGSHILVEQTPILGKLLGVSPFIISVLLLSIGTNIPEIAIAIRSVFAKHKEIAFGNYLGSASLNTLEIGLLTLLGKSSVPAEGSNFSVSSFILGLIAFVFFIKEKNQLSKKESVVLLGCYLLFVVFEIFTGPGWKLN